MAQRESVTVTQVSPRGDLTLQDGRIVRLAGVAWPRSVLARAKLAAEVSAALLQEPVVIGDAAQHDRWGRAAAEVFIGARAGKPEIWVQGQLVEDGLAAAWPEPAARGCWAALSERTMLARQGKLGVWSPIERRALKRLGAKAHIAKPAVVLYEGVVRSVRKGRSMTFVNFAGRRGATPSLFLPAKMVNDMRQRGRDAATFSGKRIRIWADVGSGVPPRLTISSADAIEVVE